MDRGCGGGCGVEEVSRRQRHRAPKLPQVPPDQKRARHRHTQHLVRRDNHGIRTFNPLQPARLQLRIEHHATAPATIDMQPQAVLGADIRDRIQRVKRPQHRRARRRIHEERRLALPLRRLNHGVQCIRPHAAGRVDGHALHGVRPKPEHLRRFLERVVPVGRREEHEAPRAESGGLRLREQRVARDDQRAAVRGAAARLRYPARVRRVEADEGGEEPRRVLLD